MNIPVYLRILLSLSVLACAAIWWHDQDRYDTARAPERARPLPVVAGESPARIQGASSRSPDALARQVDLFPDQQPLRRSPAVETVVPAAAAIVPAPPTAPALPFTLVGAWWDGGQRTLVLDLDDAVVLACRKCAAPGARHVGDVLAPDYRLKRIERTRLVITYLPMQIEQILALDELAFKPEP